MYWGWIVTPAFLGWRGNRPDANFYGPGSQSYSMTGLAKDEGNWITSGGATAQGSNTKLNDAVTSVFDLVFTGAMDRFPKLKFVLVENEVGWIAFVTHQWDRYVRRFGPKRPIPISELPSFYVNRQVYSTFIDDLPGGAVIPVWGEDNCMWSNDYPHAASTWPNSKTVIDHTLGHLAPEIFSKVVRGNVTKLYNLPAVTRL